MADIIELKAGNLSARIIPQGAELLQLSCNGKELLWVPDARIWNARCSVLFPVIGRTENDAIRVDGQLYPMPMHGFAKDSIFETIEQSRTSCRLQLISNAATMQHFPFSFKLVLQYDLSETSLQLTVEISNPGQEILTTGFGLHPGFRWPLDPLHHKEDYRLSFADDTVLTYTRPRNRQIGPERHQLEIENGVLHLNEALFLESGLVFLSPNSRSVRFHSADEMASIRLNYPQFSQLILWTRPGSDLLCIEPCYGFADPIGFSGKYCDKPGLAHIEPGRSFQLNIEIEPEFR